MVAFLLLFAMQDTQSADAFLESDAKLKSDKGLHALHAKYSKPASNESVAKTLKALQANGHTAVVVDNREGLHCCSVLTSDPLSLFFSQPLSSI